MRLTGLPHPENRRCERLSNFTPAGIDAGVKSGVVARADHVREQASQLGLPPDALQAAVNRCNADVARGDGDLTVEPRRSSLPSQ
jgi:hypothetical protein